jgi:hypothetical protein
MTELMHEERWLSRAFDGRWCQIGTAGVTVENGTVSGVPRGRHAGKDLCVSPSLLRVRPVCGTPGRFVERVAKSRRSGWR